MGGPIDPLLGTDDPPCEREALHRMRSKRKDDVKAPIDLLAEKFGPTPPKVNFSTKIPLWLDEKVSEKIAEMRAKGFRVTRSAIATDALKHYLGISDLR